MTKAVIKTGKKPVKKATMKRTPRKPLYVYDGMSADYIGKFKSGLKKDVNACSSAFKKWKEGSKC
ncbi:MAG: hypothetical protein WC968_00045 [Bacilli bacterium]